MRKERLFKQDGKIIFHKQTDPTLALESVKLARHISESGETPMADSWHVGRIDAHVLEMWLKEAGVKFHERDKVREVIRRKLLDGDNAAFRVKDGRF